MRGQGRVYRTHADRAVFMCDYTVKDAAGKSYRYRESTGKSNKAEALDEVQRRIKLRKAGRPVEPPKPPTLGAYIEMYLTAKALEVDQDTGEPITARWLANIKRHLKGGKHGKNGALQFFGAARLLSSLGPDDVKAWAHDLTQRMSGGPARHYVNSLSNLFRYAKRDGLVAENPVGLLLPKEKPHGKPREADWLEEGEAARLLDAAQRYRPKRGDLGMPFAYPLIATLLLSGARPAEALGLSVDDVSLSNKIITFRPNATRRLKNRTSHRSVRLWPQLEEILRAYFREYEHLNGPNATLLFPSFRSGKEAALTDFRKLLKQVLKLADPPIRTKLGRKLTPRAFRHTYCTRRLRTLHLGEPVSHDRVGRELGHGGSAMVRRVYGHLGEGRLTRVVEYRLPKAKTTARATARGKLGNRAG